MQTFLLVPPPTVQSVDVEPSVTEAIVPAVVPQVEVRFPTVVIQEPATGKFCFCPNSRAGNKQTRSRNMRFMLRFAAMRNLLIVALVVIVGIVLLGVISGAWRLAPGH